MRRVRTVLCLAALVVGVSAPSGAIGAAGTASASSGIGFGKSLLQLFTSAAPTSLQFGPDGRLYVSRFDGAIDVYDVSRTAANDYAVTASDTITAIQTIPNHNDDGTPVPSVHDRLVTGILVVGTAAHPTIYASSSDPRSGGQGAGDV